MREAEEEIGLRPQFVEMLCRAPDYLTGSGYHVTPVVAIVRPGFELRLNPHEVADAFEVPLAFLMNPANHRTGSRIWNGARRNFFEMPYEDRHIWGITAGIVPTCLFALPNAIEGTGRPGAFATLMTGRNLGVLIGPLLLGWLFSATSDWNSAGPVFAGSTTLAALLSAVVAQALRRRDRAAASG